MKVHRAKSWKLHEENTQDDQIYEDMPPTEHEQDQRSTPPPPEVHMPLQEDECTKSGPPQGHKRHHESSSSDSDKELHHDSIDAMQLALVSLALERWIQVKKKQGKKGKT